MRNNNTKRRASTPFDVSILLALAAMLAIVGAVPAAIPA